MYVVLGTNTCCGCAVPTFVGLYPDRDDAEQAGMAHDGDAKVIPVGAEPVIGWHGPSPWASNDDDVPEPVPEPVPVVRNPARPVDRRIVTDDWTPAGEIARHHREA